MNYQISTSQSELFDSTGEARYSRYGRPVQFAITFEAGNYLVYDDQGTLSRKRYNSFLLPLTAILSVRKPKRRTRVLEITEQYLPTSFIIDITGECYNDPDRTEDPSAHEQKRRLMLWDRIADTILVSGKGFEDLDITELEITDIAFTQLPGKPDRIPFAIRAESHIPFEIKTGTGNG
jgi:hypothetical protein